MNRLKRWSKELLVLVLLAVVVSFAMDWLRSPQAPAGWPDTPWQTLAGKTVSLQEMSQENRCLSISGRHGAVYVNSPHPVSIS